MEFLPYIGLAGVFSPYQVPGLGAQMPGTSKFKTRGPYSAVNTGDTGVDMKHPVTGQATGTIDTGNIDFNNKDQIMAIQQAINDQGLVGKDGNPLAVDGMFGENTEHAYRQYINDKRTSRGKDAYGYGTDNVNDTTDANANLGPVQGPQNQDYGNIPPFLGASNQNNNGYNGPFLDGGNNNNLGPVQGPDTWAENEVYSGPYSPEVYDSGEMDFDITKPSTLNFGTDNQGNETSVDVPGMSGAEMRAKNRADSGQYVWNRKYRQKYAPGTTLWDMFK